MAPADAPRIQRGEPVALVLGAGGARGLAQIGVIDALVARGIDIVAVAGSSSGALVGGLFAAGQLHVFRDWLLSMSRTDMLRLLDPVFGRPALFEGTRLMAALRERTGDVRIEDLPVDFTAVAVDLMRQREVWLRQGDLWDAVRGSIAIPGIFTPHRVNGRELVDGGLLGRGEADGDQVDTARYGFTELMSRSLDTMQAQIARVQLALDPPELVIRIPRDACQFYEFWRARELIAIGRHEADKALDEAGY